jgi:hypothetical protein
VGRGLNPSYPPGRCNPKHLTFPAQFTSVGGYSGCDSAEFAAAEVVSCSFNKHGRNRQFCRCKLRHSHRSGFVGQEAGVGENQPLTQLHHISPARAQRVAMFPTATKKLLEVRPAPLVVRPLLWGSTPAALTPTRLVKLAAVPNLARRTPAAWAWILAEICSRSGRLGRMPSGGEAGNQ